MIEMQDTGFTSPAGTPPHTPRRPLTPGLSSGGILEGIASYRRSQFSPIGGSRCLSASPTLSIAPPTSKAMTPLTSQPARITPGTYVAFALATPLIADHFEQDPETYELIRDFDRNRYLGLVSDSFSYTTPEGDVVNEIIVHHVSRWSPSPSVVEHHCIPIYPCTTTDPEDSERPPLRTSTLFPYANCKQWTALGVKITADVVHESTLSFVLPDDELSRFDECAVVDYREQRLIKDSKPELGAEELMKLDSAPHALPAEVWKDVRLGNEYSDPTEFIEEVKDLEL